MSMNKSKHNGFTILELMVVVAMMGVLMAVGIPTFNTMITTNELAETTNDLVLSLKRARAEAISSGRDAVVCSTADGFTCSGVAGRWTTGWLVFVDRNMDGQYKESDGELVWSKAMDGKTRNTITPSPLAGLTNDFTHTVLFSYTGELKDGTAGGFQICSGVTGSGYPRRDVTVTVGGEAQFIRNTVAANNC